MFAAHDAQHLFDHNSLLRHQKNKVRVAQAGPLSNPAGIVGFLQLRRAWVAGCFCVLAPATGSCPSQCQLVRGFTLRDGWSQIRQLAGRLRNSLNESRTRNYSVNPENLIIRDHLVPNKCEYIKLKALNKRP